MRAAAQSVAAPGKSTAVSPKTTAARMASAAVLRPQGQRQQNNERRDGRQATHTVPIINPETKKRF